MNNDSVNETLRQLYPQMVAWRRHLHQHPELSFQEKETSRWIAERLEGMNCRIDRGVGGYGVVATFQGRKPGPAVALRADMDALPIQDMKTCEYASKVPNVMHACGHDGHTAALLAAASYYDGCLDSLAGERRLIFQPAEETTPGGAVHMIQAGAMEGIDAVYGVHLWSPLPYGQASSRPGAFMSAADEFTLEIRGKGGHGGLPHQSVDTIVVGAAIVQAVQSIVSRSVNPLQPAVVTIGSFQAGSTNNVIAETCVMKGTVRSFDEATRKLMLERLEAIVRHTCAQFGAECDYQLRPGYPPVVNDETEAARFAEVASSIFGAEQTLLSEPLTVAEDFAYYLQRAPGCFMFVGAGNPACGAVHSHHHPLFDIDERSMLHAARLLIGMAEHYAASRQSA